MRKSVALIALIVVPAAAQAQFFVEGTFGGAKADLDEFDKQGFATDNATGTWSLGAGYMFNRHLGIEAGYRTLGEHEISAIGAASTLVGGQPFTATGAAVAKAETHGVYVGPVFETYIERFRLLARTGMFAWQSDITASGAASYAAQAIPAGGSITDKDDGLDPYVGLGVSYALTGNAFLGLSWTRFRIIDEVNVDAWDIRLKYAF
jgi:opacity protein-like surface antigen